LRTISVATGSLKLEFALDRSSSVGDEPTSPAILRFKLHGNTLTQTGRVELNSIDPTTYDAAGY